MSDVPDLSSDDERFEEDEWQEMEISESAVTCLFCPKVNSTIEEAFKHCENVHNFKFDSLKLRFNMDCYSYIKLINFIKTHKPSPEVITKAENILWDDDVYLKPVENDEWLMFDFESLSDGSVPTSQAFHANVENGLVTLSQAHFVELQKTIQNLNNQLKENQSLLQMAKEDMDTMKKSVKTLVEGGNKDTDNIVVNCVSKVALEDDEGYFNSYSHFGIHYEMLSDKIRTESYRNAIMNNNNIIKGKTVLDLGCGTGILSMFCAASGAKTVYALDQSDIVFHAMDIIRENNLHEIIKVVKGRLENTKLDENVDVIVSEWMGYFLLFEGMLDSVIYARDNWLKAGGILLPNRCNISIMANGDVDAHKKFIDFWSDVYGFKMNCMKTEVVREASISYVDSQFVLSESYVVQDIDISKCSTDVMDFTSDFALPILKDGLVTSLVGYFDTFFDLQNAVSFFY
ncbi:Protein arginine N-methyltransferase 3 [Eumeta japonica]|uniref:type I protein arginine methyltransferase n=1 Tax=Eumeta variegata TaxID=151549 RepID=A0A4C1Z0W1_EUMVA|nr:Protein arginine N-methyltransferase 3 [Eumeta japonica]